MSNTSANECKRKYKYKLLVLVDDVAEEAVDDLFDDRHDARAEPPVGRSARAEVEELVQ